MRPRRDAEALKIQTEAENDAQLCRLEAEKERIRITAEAERERLRIRLASELEEARSLKEHPQLLRLRPLVTLKEMAQAGGRFVIGLSESELAKALDGDNGGSPRANAEDTSSNDL